MSFFDFLKKSEEKKETVLVKTFNLNEIETFLDKKADELGKEVYHNLEQTKREISEEKDKLKKNLETLENAELKNKEIPERAKHIMQGNRQIYVQKVNSLLEKTTLPEKPQELFSFLEKFDRELDTFDKGIAKSHHIMEEFFVEKASVIAVNVKKIDKLFKELKQSTEKSYLSKIEELKKQTSALIEKINKTKESKNKLSQIEKEINHQEKELKQKEIQISKLQQGDSHKQTLSLINSKAELEKEINEINSKLRHSFSEIEPALKKYENLSQNRLAKRYLEDSLNALLEDKELEILKILDATQKAIIKHEITLKDTKKDRVMNELFNLNEDFFKSFLEKRIELLNNLSEKTAQIETSQILKDLAELEKSLNQDKLTLQEKNLSLEKMKKELGASDFSDLTASLENDFKEKLNLEIKII